VHLLFKILLHVQQEEAWLLIKARIGQMKEEIKDYETFERNK
jgi:hypothetical protein